ncbi:MAG: YihY/virulence factor BrkB family protein [Panacibacter sp.]
MRIAEVTEILRKAFAAFKRNDPLRLAGATAFFTTFALPPVLIIIIQLFGLIFNPAEVSSNLFSQLQSLLGKESSQQLHKILTGFQELAHNWFITIGGFLFLVFVATTLFNVVSNSLNQLWNIKLDTKSGIAFRLTLRMKSIAVIIFTGLLLLAQLLASGLQALLANYLDELWSGFNSLLYKIITQLVFVVIAACWFTVVFKYLANAHPSWKVAYTGGLFTGILFTVGKIILGLLLTFSNLKTIFGATGSFVLILLFVFYSAFIFYYGAAFTKVWADYKRKPLQLDKRAYEYTIEEVRKNKPG